jgi:predicted PurR-regulated permease PerM
LLFDVQTRFRERVHEVSGGEVAGILVAVFWAILVSFLAVALARVAQTLRATTKLVADVTDQAVPLLADASAAVRSAQTQIDRVDAIATDVQEVTSNASALSTTVASTFGGPLVKVAAFGYGVRRALGGRKDGAPARTPESTVIVGRTVPAGRRQKPKRGNNSGKRD